MFIDESQYGSFEFLGAEWDNDSVIRKLKGRKVVELHLNETSVDDDFFQSLQLKNLRRLYLNSSILGDAGVADALERCFCLECLRLSTPLVTDDSMSLIPKHQTIVDISLVESSVTDSGLHYLSDYLTFHRLTSRICRYQMKEFRLLDQKPLIDFHLTIAQ